MRRATVTLTAFLVSALMSSAVVGKDEAPRPLIVQSTFPKEAAAMAFGFGALWAMSDGRMVRIDAADGSLSEIDVPLGDNSWLMELDKYRGIAVGEGAVWVPDMAGQTIFKIDPDKEAVVMEIPTDMFGSRGSIGVGEGAVWVITFENHDKTVTRYNAASGVLEAAIQLPEASTGVLVAHGSVWVSAAARPELYRIDPETNTIAATIDLYGASHLLAEGDGSVWMSFDKDGLVQRIDGASGEVLATIKTGVSDMESDGDIVSGGGYIWTITRGSVVARIDPSTNTAKGTFKPAPGESTGRRIRFGGGSLWLSGNAIYRAAAPD